MYPNTFLRTFWRAEIKPQVFVAMSFADEFKPRFDNVIVPAIRGINHNNVPLEPYRVDLSKTGDSILTDIMDGIAHSRFILADVSTIGRDSVSGEGYRNSNVLYEVGIALACRPPQDVLLIRSDKDRFLFDVSTIPHMTLDFTDAAKARLKLRDELLGRLQQQQFIEDARVQMAIASLTTQEIVLLKFIADLKLGQGFGAKDLSTIDFSAMVSVPRLLDKQLIRVMGQFEGRGAAYAPTELGRIVAALVKNNLPQLKPGPPETVQPAQTTELSPPPAT